MLGLKNKLNLRGFNNLTKTLSINVNGGCYEKSKRMHLDERNFIDLQSSSMRLHNILDNALNLIVRQIKSDEHLSFSRNVVHSVSLSVIPLLEGVKIFRNTTSFPSREAIK